VVPDRFIVCGNQYKQMRELFTEVTLGKPIDALNDALAVDTNRMISPVISGHCFIGQVILVIL